MTFIHALILSFVEGLTEFLPISSTGHLILASELLHITQTEFTKTFEIVIQFGAILAVVAIYFQTLLSKRYLWKKLFISFLPAALLGFILYKLIKGFLLQNPLVTVISLILGGIILILFEKFFSKKVTTTIQEMTVPQLLLIGIGQSLAIIPGVSRSAASIVSAMIIGLSKEEAVEFSFLLAIPTIAAASLYDLLKTSISFQTNEIIMLLIGTVGSFIFAFIAIKFFLSYVRTHSFAPFGIYRIVIGVLFLFFAR